MASLYSNENIPTQVVLHLRNFGYDVLTSLEAGRANLRIPDDEVLRFAAAQQRAIITHNRRDFLKLHNSNAIPHCGIILCTEDYDFLGLAQRIHKAIASSLNDLRGKLLRINRPK